MAASDSRAAKPHERLERAAETRRHVLALAGLGEPGQREHRQRARRILEVEVAVRDLSVRDRVAVALVPRRVEDLVVRVEADVEQRPRQDEERDRCEQRRADRRFRQAPARDVHSPAPQTRRRGRTTGCTGRTSASARARSRSAAHRSARRAEAASSCAARTPRQQRRGRAVPARIRCTTCRSGMPRAWYWAQSQSENGDSRVTCVFSVRS